MNKIILSGKILKEIIITCEDSNSKSFCYLQNYYGNYLINVDNELLKSMGDLSDVIVEGKLCYQKVKSQNSHFWYIDAEKISENMDNAPRNCISVDLNILHTTEFYNRCYLIFGQLDKNMESIVEVEYHGDMKKKKKLNIKGYLIPQQLDKNGFFEYIINANTIENYRETEREDYERLQM